MNANFGLMHPLDPPVKDKFKKKEALAERALREMTAFARVLTQPPLHVVERGSAM